MSDREPTLSISREEVMSPRVDDLLHRQRSLRGGGGRAPGQGGRWYYRNWFVFLLAGLLGGLAAWGISEPSYDDCLYVRGPVTAVEPWGLSDGSEVLARVQVDSQWLMLWREAQFVDDSGQGIAPVDLEKIEVGRTLGFYVRYYDESEDVGVVAFVDPSPGVGATSASLKSQSRLDMAWGFLIFPLVAGMVGLFIGAADGIVCRLPARAILAGGVGLAVGLLGGLMSTLLGGLVYGPLNMAAMGQEGDSVSGLSALGFTIQVCGRSLAWAMIGVAMGLGQGIALRSWRLTVYGLIGGVAGGALGGLLFDPIDLVLLGGDHVSAGLSRGVGFGVIGATVGGMIGLVELLSRDAWLEMVEGPLAGKEFLLFKDTMTLGSSPTCDIYLFNDPGVAEIHARLHSVGDGREIHAVDPARPVLVNNRPTRSARLNHGDRIALGRTVLVFQHREG